MPYDFTFPADGETLAASIDYNAERSTPAIISLHGGGPEARQRIAPLTTFLADNGHSVLRFDHSGWGDSTGNRSVSSLRKRVNEVLAVQTHLATDRPLTVIATSMGGHVALELLPYLNIETLILFCPAAYAAEAFDVPFGPDFTAIIRRPDSYRSATAFQNLERFMGRFMMLNGTDDPIIPDGVIEQYETLSVRATQRHIIKLDGAPHNIMGWLVKNPDRQEQVFTTILQMIQF